MVRFYPYDAECFIEYLKENNLLEKPEKMNQIVNNHHVYVINSPQEETQILEVEEDEDFDEELEEEGQYGKSHRIGYQTAI